MTEKEDHKMTKEVMQKMLEEIGTAVGLEWPTTSAQVFFFKNQVPLLVKGNAKAAALWEKECEIARLKTFGR